MTKKSGALANALRNSGATVAATPPADPMPPPDKPAARQQASRAGTAPITVHLAKEVRRQLKTLAADQERKVEDMVAEALNLLFAKYRKPEIAPRK
jgi:hypothetical protein